MGVAAITLGAMARAETETKRPNFIFYITDDISFDDLSCYGNPFVKTPHLARLAAEGLVFDNAYLSISSCSPSRCSFITGRYPHNHGAPELHTELPIDQHAFPNALRQAGYYTALSGKNHIGDVKRAFDLISPGKGPGKQEDWVDILRQRPKNKPFFFWFASADAHRDWQIDDTVPVYDPDQIQTPPVLYDGPQTRKDLAGYFHEISRADHYLGQLRRELERQDIADNTVIVFCSDNGRPFPRCKTRLYDSGIKAPLIVWQPGTIKPGRTGSLVSAIDVAPTVLELAEVSKDPRIQGVSFAAVLKDPKATVRQYAFAEHNWHVFQAHERMVRYQNWLYIRNAWPQRQSLCVESNDTYPAGRELWQQHERGQLHPHQADVFRQPRPSEELYDVQADPHQFTNLAESALEYHRNAIAHLRQVLDRWIEQTGDTIPENPTGDRETLSPQQDRQPRRGTLPGAERNAESINHPGPIRRE